MKNEDFKPFDYFNGRKFKSSEETALFFKSIAIIESMRDGMRWAMSLRDREDENQYFRKKFENEIETKIIELENAIRDVAWEDITMNLGDSVNVQFEEINL